MNKVAKKVAVKKQKVEPKKAANKNLIVAEAVAGASLLASLAGLAVYLFGHGKPTKVQAMKMNVMRTVKKAEKQVKGEMKNAKKKVVAKMKKMRK